MRQEIQKKIQRFTQNHQRKKRLTILLSGLSIVVAVGIFYALMDSASTTISRNTASDIDTPYSWATAAKIETTKTSGSAVQIEGTTDSAVEAEPEGEVSANEKAVGSVTEETTPASVKSRRLRHNAVRMAEDSSDLPAPVDFGPYIVGATIRNASGQEVTQISDGDNITVTLSYFLPSGTVSLSNKRIQYQLTSGVAVKTEQNGNVYQNGTAVGTYTISTNGMIVVTFYDSFVADESAIQGMVAFEGEAHLSQGEGGQQISFGSAGTTVTINPKQTPTEETTDVTVWKTADNAHYTDGKIHYTITVSTTKGTSDVVKVTDSLCTANVSYDPNSFQCIKKANGATTNVNVAPAILTDGDTQSFVIDKLKQLKAGEIYTITYTASPEDAFWSSLTASGGVVSGTVKNRVIAESGKDKGGPYETVTSLTLLQKTGTYDSSNRVIHWTITLNSSNADLKGYTISDKTTDPNGKTVTLPDQVNITPALNGQNTISLPYTFHTDNATTYLITYSTPISNVPVGMDYYKNNVTITNGTHTFSTGDVSVGVGGGHLTKKWESEEAIAGKDGAKYTWEGIIQVPETGLPGGNTTYNDRTNYGTSPFQPMTFTGGTWFLKVTGVTEAGTETVLQENTDYTLVMQNEKTNIWYTPAQLKANPDVYATYFQVAFLKNIKQSEYKTVHIQYATYADYSGIADNETGYFRNTNWLTVNRKSEWTSADHNHKRTASLMKQGGYTEDWGTWGVKYGDNLSFDYDKIDNHLYYRLLINTGKDQNGDLDITDTIPDGTTLDRLEARFYPGNYYPESVWSPRFQKMEYISNLFSYTNEDGKLHLHVKSGYEGYPIIVWYSLSIAGDSYWNDTNNTSKTYINMASLGSNTVTQTQTVKRTYNLLEKTGVQGDGKDESPNVLTYRIIVNPQGKKLNTSTDVTSLTLLDKVNVPLENLKNFCLVQDSVKMYRFNPLTGDHKGTELDPSLYSYQYNSQKYSTTFTVPDSMGIVLEYKYYFEPVSATGNFNISNSASLNGVTSGTGKTSFTVDCAKSAATAVHSKLTIYKVDSANYKTTLPGAHFTLSKYNSSSQKWADIGAYVTNSSGVIVYDDVTKASAVAPALTLYRLTETQAPTGYSVTDPYYFVWAPEKDGNGNVLSLYTVRENMSETVKAVMQTEPELSADDVHYFAYTGGVAYIADEYSSLQVKKVWLNSNGTTGIPENNSVPIQLYRQMAQCVGPTVTIKAATPAWNGYQYVTKTLQVKYGSDLTVEVSQPAEWLPEWKITKDGNFVSTLKATTDSPHTIDYTINNITSDCTYQFTTQLWGDATINLSGYSEPDYEGVGTKEKVNGGNVFLNSDNHWMYTWNNLPKTGTDASGNAVNYYYSVQETKVPSGYSVVYSANNGNVSNGQITVINTKVFSLPDTGGCGVFPIVGLGALLVFFFNLFYWCQKRKFGEGREKQPSEN